MGLDMAIQSYLVYAKPGCRKAVVARLREIPQSDVCPAKAHDVVILVTETDREFSAQSLEERLAGISEANGFALVAGYSEELIGAEEM